MCGRYYRIGDKQAIAEWFYAKMNPLRLIAESQGFFPAADDQPPERSHKTKTSAQINIYMRIL
jgi:hypothetical protein